MSHEFSQLSFDTVIPSAILINENIDMKAVKLFAFIKGLTKAYGYCFATNEYLSNLMKSDIRSIQRWLIMLKKEGYLEIETEKNGIHWQRRLYVSDKFKKNLRRDMDVTPPWHGCHPPMTSVSPITKEYSNEDKLKKEREEAAPAPFNFFKDKFEGKIIISDENYQRLLIKFKDALLLERYAEKLYRWSFSNIKKFKDKTRHDMVIEDWMEKDGFGEKGSENNSITSLASMHREWAQKIITTLQHPEIEILPEGIMFINHGAGTSLYIPFNDVEFKEKTLKRLEKMKLSIKEM